jgi:hypothetical protein
MFLDLIVGPPTPGKKMGATGGGLVKQRITIEPHEPSIN